MQSVTKFENAVSDLIQNRQIQDHIPGVAFVFVKEGEIQISKSFGYANLEKKQPIDMNDSLFRVASVSKTITVLALLQLAEQGKIDLEGNTNDYLHEFKIKNKFSTPQKIKHLLLHIDGFEEKVLKANALNYESIPSLSTVFKEQLRPLFTAPGEIITYGNTGIALASYLVEKIAQIPFSQFVEKNLFSPLNMNKCIMHQNFTEEEKSRLVTIYSYKNGKYIPFDIAYSVTAGTGGASIAPNEMAHLLIALLNQGVYKNTTILKPTTVKTVLTPQFIPHKNMPGVTFGFFEHLANNERALVRDGSGFSINSRLVLWPEYNMGFFIVANSASSALSIETTQLCSDYFFPSKTQAHSPAYCAGNLKIYEGEYQTVQYSRTELSKVLKFFLGTLRVNAVDDTTLSITCDGYDAFSELTGTTHWKQIEPDVFEGIERKGRMCFIKHKGKMHILSGCYYHSTYEKLKWFEIPRQNQKMFKVFFWLFILLLLMSVMALFLTQGKPLVLNGIVAISSFLSALFCYRILPSLTTKGLIKGYPSYLFIDPPSRPWLSVLFLIPFVNLISLVVVLLLLFSGLVMQSFISNVFLSFFILISFAYLVFIKYWNLFRVRY